MNPQAYLENIQAGFYRLADISLLNQYYVVTDPLTCRLMASPEVTGFNTYQAQLPPTTKALEILKQQDSRGLDRVNILTILRGSLNYPVEEACHSCGITVSDISFMSCERIIVDGVITGLDVKYEKLHTEDDCTLVIGDIIASGATLKLCLEHVFDVFRANGHSIRKVVFFTVGGTKALSLMEEMTRRLRKFWPSFEGFQCVFYEGIFTAYSDKGVTGVNHPDIDFGWKGGAVSPEFRQYVLDYEYAPALLEKCTIYDGGARRYEIGHHAEEVIEYWEDLLSVADKADYKAFLDEKFGYEIGCGSHSWLEASHLDPCGDYMVLYENERKYAERLGEKKLREICETRLCQLRKDFEKFL